MSFCLTVCRSSCSLPLKKLRPIGRRRFKQATFKLLCGSNLFFSLFLPTQQQTHVNNYKPASDIQHYNFTRFVREVWYDKTRIWLGKTR